MSDKFGKYGLMRLEFIKNNKKELYTSLLTSGELPAYLEDVNLRCVTAVQKITSELLKANPPPDKVSFAEKWTQHMNATRQQAEEIVRNEIIYI